MTFERAQAVLDDACGRRVFPAGTAEVGTSAAPLWSAAAGTLTFDESSSKAAAETVFDLASLTKVLSTATLAALLVEHQTMRLDTRIARLAGAWSGTDRIDVTVRDLLEHCSGLPAHRRYFETLSGPQAFETAICGEPLAYAPRSASIYSDPGFMLLGFLLHGIAGPLDRQFDAWRDASIPAAEITFHPPPAWRSRIAPTEHDPWRGRLLIGEVHDENAAALDGVAGHAGLFGTAAAVGACARWWLRALRGDDTLALGPRTAQTFARRSTVPGSSRALGWEIGRAHV